MAVAGETGVGIGAPMDRDRAEAVCSDVRPLVTDPSERVRVRAHTPLRVGCLSTTGDGVEWDLLTTADCLERVSAVAYLRWQLRSHLEADRAAVRYDPDAAGPDLLLADGRLHVPLAVDGAIHTLSSDGSTLFEALRADWRRRWEHGTKADISPPSLGVVESALIEHLGPPVARAVMDGLGQVWPHQLAGAGPDALEVVVLAAARYDRTQQAVGDWAGTVGLASRGDVSRAKRRLANEGLIETTTDGGSVGRPPARLHLVTSAFEGLEPGPMADLKGPLALE